MLKKLKYVVVVFGIVCLIFIYVFLKDYNKPVSYEWVKDSNSVINQHDLFLKNKVNKYIDGYVEIIYINNKKEKVKIPKSGKKYVKSIVKKVIILK